MILARGITLQYSCMYVDDDTSQVGTISEYLPFALSQRLLRRFGVWRLLAFSQASLAVRLLAMSWYVTAEHHRLVILVTQLVRLPDTTLVCARCATVCFHIIRNLENMHD